MIAAGQLERKRSAGTQVKQPSRKPEGGEKEALRQGVPLYLKPDSSRERASGDSLESQENGAPLYTRIQPKLSLGAVDDPLEREADRVAERVSRAPSADGEVIDESSTPNMVRGKFARGEGEDVPLQAKGSPVLDPGMERRIEALRGRGVPLPDEPRREMEKRMGADFSGVSIHVGKEAAALCEQVGARAFTVGSDIFFGAGEYAPETETGRRLLAHELTHVLQQGSGLARMVQREADGDGDSSGGFGELKREYIELPYLTVPKEFKDEYDRKKPLIKHKNFKRSRDDQTNVWRRTVRKKAVVEKLKELIMKKGSPAPSRYIFEVPSRFQSPDEGTSTAFLNATSLDECAAQASIPRWDREGNPHASRTGGDKDKGVGSYDVDHVVELRFGAQHPTGSFSLRDDIHTKENFILLDSNINQNVKAGMLTSSINEALTRFRENSEEVYRGKRIKDEWSNKDLSSVLSLKFVGVRAGKEVGASGNNIWTVSEIESGQHIDILISKNRIFFRTVEDLEQQVSENECLILLGSNRQKIIPSQPSTYRDMLSPFVLTKIDNVEEDDLLRFRISIPEGVKNLEPKTLDQPLVIKSFKGSQRIGLAPMNKFPLIMGLRRMARGTGGTSVLEHPQASPISVEDWEVDPEVGLVVRGQILPTLPLFQQSGIDFELRGTEITFYKTFTIDEISIPAPLKADICTLTLFAGTQGIGMEGEVGFSVPNVGQGRLGAVIDTNRKLGAEGEFNFDSDLFDPARVELRYMDGKFGGEGEIGIPRGKVPGVKRALLSVSFSEEGFSASGDAELDIPGVESGRLAISQSEEEGFHFSGVFALSSDAPGIRGGSITIELVERPDRSGFALRGRGEAQPDIPGINGNLSLVYDDGVFTAEARARYQRGMLSGDILAGVTNRSVDERGALSDTADPDAPLVVYGGGSLTLQIAPWLQGRAGVRFAPNGELTVSGEIGLPAQLELFPRKEVEKPVFSIAVQAPIIPGVVAEIAGGLKAQAGFGPGMLDQLSLSITYNPDREEETMVNGVARFVVPADAGLRLSVRAGIGLGVTGLSATGGLEVGGAMGISGSAEAGVDVMWTPLSGLALDAEVAVRAQPSFVFDISGYVSVRALGFSVYDETYEFASFEFGPGYGFGISLPIRYREGEPFDISLDDVRFEVPDIDTDRLLKGLVSRVT